MTIEKGEPWGVEVPRPAGLHLVQGDRDLAAALRDGRPAAPVSGDLHRTIGAPVVGERATLLALPIDLLAVTLDDGIERRAVAHVVARSPWWRGSWWLGPVLFVMNSQFHGGWDVAPRGHPDDGRAEALLADRAMPRRDRWAARARLRDGTHLPHPDVSSRSVRSASWAFRRPLAVFVDGAYAGRSASVDVEVLADAATIYA